MVRYVSMDSVHISPPVRLYDNKTNLGLPALCFNEDKWDRRGDFASTI